MIGSYSNRFIFIKTRKTGGTSVEIVLSAWCSGADICIPITANDEVLRRRYGGRPMNFSEDPEATERYITAIDSGDPEAIDEAYRAIRPQLRFRNHDPAIKVRDGLPDLWPQAHTFSVDRHPYDKVVSLVYWRIARRKGGDASRFDETLDEVLEARDFVNYPLYMDGDRLAVDAVYRHEDMWSEIGALAARLGKSMPDDLPTAKAGHRVDCRPAAEILPPSAKAIIRGACAPEFDLLAWSV